MNKHEKMFSGIREMGKDWETREQNIMERLDKEIGMIRELRDAVGKITIDDPNEKVALELNSLLNSFRSKFSPEVLSRLDREIVVRAKIQELAEKAFALLDQDSELNEDEETTLKRLENEESELLDNNDVYFLYNLHGIINDLKNKHRLVQEYQKDPDKLAADLNKESLHGCNKDEIKNVTFGPFSVNLILKPDSCKEVASPASSDTFGVHLRGSAINLIKSIPEKDKLEDHIRHESYHALLDGATYLFGYSSSIHLQRFGKNFKKYFPADTEENKQELKERLSRLTASRLLNPLHQEILTDLDSKKLKNFYEVVGFTPLEPISLKKNKELLKNMSTAGYEVNKIAGILFKQAKVNPDEEIRKSFENLGNRFLSLFARNMAQYGLGRDISFRIGKEAEENVEILSHILSPSQFHHIPRFLKYKYGEDNVNEAVKYLVFSKKLKWLARQIRETGTKSEAEKKFLKAIFGEEIDEPDTKL